VTGGEVYCWGYSKWYELDCGKQYVRGGEVYCWGYSKWNELDCGKQYVRGVKCTAEGTVNGMNWTVGNST
jgi:alpha-tubulin suppressor-like RCC1 family protein